VGDPNHAAERSKRETVMAEIMTKLHNAECTLSVQGVQVPCAELTSAVTLAVQRSSRMHEHLKAWREACDLTQTQVANKLGTTHATVSRWESGVQAIHPKTFRRLADVYGATPAELLVSPLNRAMALRFHQAAEIISRLDDQEVEQWLGIGHSLAKREK
jgi:transcriptional regulator with XRE-family HTH domain